MRAQAITLSFTLALVGGAATGCGGGEPLSGDGGGGSGGAADGAAGQDGGGQAADRAGGGGGVGGGLTIDQLAGKAAELFCDVYKTCFGAYFDIVLGAECKTTLGRQFEDGFAATLKKAVAEGRVRYQADKAQACLDALRAAGCDTLDNANPAECEAAIEGTVKAGGACTIHDECEGVAFCKVDAMCPGVCSALLAEGASCTGQEACQTGLVCQTAGMNRGCVKPVSDGGACGGASAPPCRSGLLCVGSSSAQTCKTSGAVFVGDSGGTCDPQTGTLCKSGLYCVIESAGMAGLVARCGAAVASGAPCKLAFPEQCPAGEYCSGTNPMQGRFDGVCARLPTAGQACASTTLGQPRCAGDLECDASGGAPVCRARERLGGPCTAAAVCYSNRCTGGQCVAGDACGP